MLTRPARIVALIFCCAAMGTFVWFGHWLVYAHSSDFGNGLVVGMGIMAVLFAINERFSRDP